MKSVAIFIILILSGAIFARSDCNATLKSAFGEILEENNVQLVELMHSFNACPMNWTRIDAACYFIPEERLNYDEARQKCQELSGYMGSVWPIYGLCLDMYGHVWIVYGHVT